MPKTLVIPDLHEPHAHPAALDFLADLVKAERPDDFVCIGDEIDSHAVSAHPKDPDQDAAGREFKLAVDRLKKLYAITGKKTVRVCKSNHTWRPFRAAFAAGIPSRVLRSIREILEAPSTWTWADFWDVGNVLYCHGEGFSGPTAALTAAKNYRRNVVIGHVHSAGGVAFNTAYDSTIFGLSTGCLIDATAPVFAYAKYTASRPVLGCAMVDDGFPVFMPLERP